MRDPRDVIDWISECNWSFAGAFAICEHSERLQQVPAHQCLKKRSVVGSHPSKNRRISSSMVLRMNFSRRPAGSSDRYPENVNLAVYGGVRCHKRPLEQAW